jgi:hypothetical protein
VPVEAHCLEALHRLLDERPVSADDPERARGERAGVALGLEKRRRFLLDAQAIAQGDKRIEPCRRLVEAPRVATRGELLQDLFGLFEVAAEKREPQERRLALRRSSDDGARSRSLPT